MTESDNPYLAPAEETDSFDKPSGVHPSQAAFPFRSASRRGHWTTGLIAGCLLLAIFSIGLQLLTIDRIEAELGGSMGGMVDRRTFQTATSLHGLLSPLLSLVAGVAFLNWLHLSHRNLVSLAATSIRFSPGWAVGYYFIPLLNFFRPYQVMREVWAGSDPGQIDGSPVKRSPARMVGNWWTAWLLASLAPMLWASFVTMEQMRKPHLVFVPGHWASVAIQTAWVSIAAGAASIAAGVFIILIIRKIDANQISRHELLQTDIGLAHQQWLAENGPAGLPSDLSDEHVEALLYGVDLIAERTDYFADWSAAMMLEFGDWMHDDLEEMFHLAKEIAEHPRHRWAELAQQTTDPSQGAV